MTYRESYDPAMAITDQAEADKCFEGLVKQHLKVAPEDTRERTIEVQKMNLGYWAGYYSTETRVRVERLFSCAHPIFGSIEEHGQPTFQEAIDTGKALAQEPS